MAILIRASDVPENRRHDAWRGIVCDTLGPLDLRIDPDAPLRGQIEAGRLDTVTVAHAMTSTPHSMHRTPGLIRRASPELYRVVLVMAGSLVLTQRERSSRLRAGEFAVYDFTQPYDVAYDSAVELAVFSLPHESLTLVRDPVRALTAVPFAPDEGAAALAGPLLRRVALDLETYQPASAARLSSVVLNLITTAIAERADQTAVLSPETQQRALLMRVHDFIEQRLGDLDLSPGMIAAAHHVSLRYLHRLFESQNTTVGAWIRHRRLERCRADLADALLRTLPVSAVAARWGLPDAAHFSRLFKQTYGMPPAEYRRMRA